MTKNAPPPNRSDDSDEQLRETLRQQGFLHPDRSRYNLRALSWADSNDLIARAKTTTDPDLALNGLEQITQKLGAAHWAENPPSPLLLDRLLTIAANSEQLIDSATDFLDELATENLDLSSAVLTPCTATTEQELQRWHRWQMLRVCLCELLGHTHVEEVATALTQLADETVMSALRLIDATNSTIAVFAVGKWGSEELNYSSDIDLFFVRTDRSDPIAAEQTVQKTLQILNGGGGIHHLYRTDLRLRPGGASAALAPSHSQARQEFRATGGTWERMVHIRTRFVGGPPQLGRDVAQELQEFVYERPFRLQDIRKIKGYKDLLEKKSDRDDVEDRELKVGIGGIRDVEYVVQFLQLLHGNIYVQIRGGNIFQALHRLGRVGALAAAESGFLDAAYRFLRQAEHRLMLRHRRQSFLLPTAADAQRALARSLDFDDWPSFREEFDRLRAGTREILNRLFHRVFTAVPDDQLREVNLVLAFRPEQAEIDRVFAPLHFRDPQKAYTLLRRLAYPGRKALQAPRARQFLAHLFPQLLACLRRSPDPDQAVLIFTNCVETLGAPAVFYQLLSEKPENCELFVELFGNSRFLSDLLLENPGILDELIDRLRAGTRISEEQLVEELSNTLEHSRADHSRIYNEFRALHLLEIALLDLNNTVSLLGTLERLSAVARALLRCIDQEAESRLQARFGVLQPLTAGSPPPRHTILALGRLGGNEIGYASDIDMILVYDGEGRTADGMREQEFYTHLLQEVIATIAHPGRGGALYSVDLRLRPRGEKGSLVHSFREFQSYFLSNESQIWEHQALVRSSPAAGDLELGSEVLAFVRKNLGRDLARDEVIADMIDMHERRKQTPPGEGVHLKSGPGGILDIEFLVQSGILLACRKNPEIWEPNTDAAIGLLRQLGVFSDQEAATLRTAYRFFRLVENRLSMLHRSSVRQVPTDDQSLRSLARRIGYAGPGDTAPERLLHEELTHHTTAVLRIFERHCAR
ncbi:MAG: hypothetical protein AAF581_01400 [Planctomycetota bacterium]